MDNVRVGRSLRALRLRRAWRQVDLAREARLSQSTISRVELGDADRLSIGDLERIAAALGARVDVRLSWRGEGLDRLLDDRHAALVERIVFLLRSWGWEVAPEASFSIRAEHGSIDVLAWSPASAGLLVVEVKSAIGDVQMTLATLDRKRRLAPLIARQRGWSAHRVGRLLVLPDERTPRRQVERHAATFRAALPVQGRAMLAWLRNPGPGQAASGIVFLSVTHVAGGRQRQRVRQATQRRPPSSNPTTEAAARPSGPD